VKAITDITGYHAHVYYDSASRESAERVRNGLGAFHVQLGRWHDRPVGPHPQSMYQVAFDIEHFDQVVPWLMLNREGFNVLVHPETGDDLIDHTRHALWLGQPLELNTRIFERV